MSVATLSKAHGFVADDAVTELPPVRALAVQSGTRTYMVVVCPSAPGVRSCTCPAPGRCSHIEAAELLVDREASHA